jgi:hypothetical protein
MYIYVNSTTQRCPNKIIKIFQLGSFFHLPPVSLTPVANLELPISLRIRNGPTGIIRGLGETVPLNGGIKESKTRRKIILQKGGADF